MNHIAIYARYSCEQQRDTSIEDQLTRCRDVASRYGLTASDIKVYADSALSGLSKHTQLRDGYQKLLFDLKAGVIAVLIVDEFSRLTRDVVEQAKLTRLFEENQRIRLLTADGIDTHLQNWQLQTGLVGIINQQAGRDTRHRVIRGMLGQLERGYMIATPAFGYALKRHFNDKGERTASEWVIHEKNADIVRQIFEQRGNGRSMHQIAKWLNDTNVPVVRAAQSPTGGFWRPARIKNILGNTIYRGVFLWNASSTVKYRAEKSGRTLEIKAFDRPQLRLVPDDLWERCNAKTISRSGYGGGKHALAGLVQCGYCNSVLAVSSKSRCRSLYCASCSSAKAMKDDSQGITSSVAVDGMYVLLQEALKGFLTPEVIASFRDRLRAKLDGNLDEEIGIAKSDVARCSRIQERLSHLLGEAEDGDDTLLARYRDARSAHANATTKLEQIVSRSERIDAAVLDKQLAVDPLHLLPKLFQADIEPEKLRSVLSRLFPSIVFEGKGTRYNAYFKVAMCMGAATSILSSTHNLDESPLTKYFHLRYYPTTKDEGGTWRVFIVSSAENKVKASSTSLNPAEILANTA